MARIRAIKPAFFLDEDLAELSPLHRLLFAGLWTLADADGRLEDRPKRIKVEILPYDKCDVNQMLEDLCKLRDNGHSFIIRYAVDGQGLISIPRFRKHQRITGKEAGTESEYPPPPEKTDGETSGKQQGNIRERNFFQEGKGREGKGKEIKERNIKERKAEIYSEIIEDLNEVLIEAGIRSSYDSESKATRKLIDALLIQGRTAEDFWNVHRNKTEEWSKDDKMRKFLRPGTLYLESHFGDYLGQKARRKFIIEEEKDGQEKNG